MRKRAASPGSDSGPGANHGSELEEPAEDADAAAAVLEADVAQLQVTIPTELSKYTNAQMYRTILNNASTKP